MIQRHDSEYQAVVEKLNDAFKNASNEKNADVEGSYLLPENSQKDVKDMPYEDMRRIKLKIRSKVESLEYLTKKESDMLDEIQQFRSMNYRLTIWRMTGEVQTKQIMQDYTRFLAQNPVFRSIYIYRGMTVPVKIQYENKKESTFPIYDLRSLAPKEQKLTIKNVLAAESRRLYDMETDLPFHIQGYLMGRQELLVVVAIYPYLYYPMGVREMMHRIFEGMHHETETAHAIDEKTIRQMNESIRQSSIGYWRKMLLPRGENLTVPGSGKMGVGKCFLYEELGVDLTEAVISYCRKNQVAVRTMFLYAWADILGKYHDEKNPAVLLAERGEQMNLLPVKAMRQKDHRQAMTDMQLQMEQSQKNTSCTRQDLETQIGCPFSDYFGMLHSFADFRETEEDRETMNPVRTDEMDMNLCVSYQIFDKNIIISYLSRKGIPEFALENLHMLLTEELSMLLQTGESMTDQKMLFQAEASAEEKQKKLRAAQSALYLKESGLFEELSVEELMKLAENSRLCICFSGDIIISEGDMCNSLFILGRGTLEESRMAPDGMVKSLRILKKGDVFGTEALCSRAEAFASYTIVASRADLVEIDRDVLMNVGRKHASALLAVMEKEHEAKCKFQRLWMTL